MKDLPVKSIDTDPHREFAWRAKLVSRWFVRHTEKRVLPIEQDVRTVSRQSLTTTRDFPLGHVLTRADLTIKRPGTGIPPYALDATIGRRLTRSIETDMPLMAGDVE